MDLHCALPDGSFLAPGEIRLVPTGIRIALPPGYEAQIRPRSGLALKNGVTLVNTPGTIDSDYRGHIQLIMINHGKASFKLERGMRLAQMVIHEVAKAELEIVTELDETARSIQGFGHTGR